MDIIALRGHRLDRIANHLMKKGPNSLRVLGKYDETYFIKNAEFYDEAWARNWVQVHNKLFEDNPLIRLVDTPEIICKPTCPYLVEKKGIECSNPFLGLRYDGETLEDRTKLLKEGDNKAIQRLGFTLGQEVRFSQALKKIINSVFIPHFIDLNPEAYKQKLDEIIHPKIMNLY
jgi:hypothetical protein